MTDPTHTHPLSPDWQILGELELPVGLNANGALQTWLTELLAPLGLHTDFLNKVLRSAQDSTERAPQPSTEMTLGHVHLSIFAPHLYTSKGKTWGFFRIEKIESATADKNFPDHAIEYYLYLEGQ